MFGLWGIAGMMKNSKSLMAHPNKLTYYMCMVEAVACWHGTIEIIGAERIILYMRLDDFLSLSLFKKISNTETLYALRRSNILMFQFAMFFSLGLNFCKSLDMTLVINDPFYPAHRRMKKYYLLSLIISVTFTCLSIGWGLGKATVNTQTVFESTFTVTVISLFFIIAIFSSVSALRLTTRPGISRNMRKNFANSFICYTAIYSMSWLVYYFVAYYLMFYTALFGNAF
jgi:hypothetical protein